MIHIENLCFGYNKKEKPLFEHLNCTLKAGSIIGLLGKNGAGKTTLLKLILGLRFPDAGKISVLDHQPGNRRPSFLQDVYFLSEEFETPYISIDKYVKANSAFYPRFDHDLLNQLLEKFELTSSSKLHRLSYGQKKKFLISFALATKSKLMVLDEPTNGLDIPSKATFRSVLAGALDEQQLVIISTHQVKDIENLIDRLLLLENGKFSLQKDMLEIASQLNFSISSTDKGEEVLYSEMAPGGYKVITPQRNGSSSVDMELLFNAVTSGTEKVKEYVK